MGGVAGNTLNGHITRGLASGPDRLLYRDIFLDTALMTRIVSSFPEIDEGRLAADGGRQGGGLTLACASLSNIQLAAPCYPFLSDYQRVWEMDLDKDAYAELKDFFRHVDPQHKKEDAIFEMLVPLAQAALAKAREEAAELGARYAELDPGAEFTAADWTYVESIVRRERESGNTP